MTDKDIVNVCSTTRSIMYYLSTLIQHVESAVNERVKAVEDNEPHEFC